MQKKDTLFFDAHNDSAHSMRIIVKIDKKSATCYYLVSKYEKNVGTCNGSSDGGSIPDRMFIQQTS